MENDKEMPVLSFQDALSHSKDSVKDFKIKLKTHSFDFDSVDEKGKTLLIHLVETMVDTDRLWVVLEFFADPNIKDLENEKTALHYACKAGHKGMILALLLFGAHIDVTDKEEKKPFDHCPTLKEDLEQILEHISKYKPYFIQLTRKRRKVIKDIFDSIDQETKIIDDIKMAT